MGMGAPVKMRTHSPCCIIAGEARAGLRRAGEEQGPAGDDVCGAHRVAVHGAGVERGLGVFCDQRLVEDAAVGARQREWFRAGASGCG